MKAKKRVLLIVNSDLINAGVPNVVMTIVRNLSDRFFFDVVTYHGTKGQYDDEFKSYGGKIFNLSLLKYEKHKILYPLRYFQIKKAMREILSKNKYDVVHCHNGVEAGIFLKCAKQFKIKTRLAHAHGTYSRKGSNKLLIWYYSCCKKFISKYATTALACASLAGKSLFGEKEFVNVLNPVDISLYKNQEKAIHDGCNLLQIGYFCANKNQIFSINLLKSLLDEKVNAKLTFIGYPQDEIYYSKMLKTIDEFSLKDYVVFLPKDADKSKEFSKTDVVLMPSKTEGLPLVALEAQAAKVASLLSDHIACDANIGLATYAEYNNLADWTKKVIEIYENRDSKVETDTSKIETNLWCNRIEAIYNG